VTTRSRFAPNLLACREIALIDVREEDPFAQSHPLWAANLSLSALELDAWGRIPRRGTRHRRVRRAETASMRARRRALECDLGYTNVHLLEGGLCGWREPRKASCSSTSTCRASPSANWLESKRHTPSLSG
jgi:rhodanese-related sulfurtransferase